MAVLIILCKIYGRHGETAPLQRDIRQGETEERKGTQGRECQSNKL